MKNGDEEKERVFPRYWDLHHQLFGLQVGNNTGEEEGEESQGWS